ncbi:hypothetical protein APA73_33690 [Pseudomonas aeruginosa]|uniref:restriction endonuclease subunit S n=1 Tax=Pseudomonas aeruginosa TaxID=287 RepID=UPI0009ACD5FB|nr:restriction endonuclease subunit S [Pseudomonas aeruginosa]KSL66681.2 hypothetical protein APA58_21715 [Pseudomonas aeruginosa]KSM86615.2 hypothetical protein APA73_33690 [Pseudomonas aeruginosa]MDI2561584.1 restriction endonuclease subunit S [Pseudomonas aeruginosa]HBN9636155.1 restriction endonuclease subunit S [Pseudomonas aeruginosa]HCF4140523.1 restriction endonuclease subunit S [Pseudomonas aeruginosa]
MSVFLEAPLESLCRKVTDGTHDSPKSLPDGVPFIKGKHISQGRLNLDYCDYISREDHLKVIARSKPERGDTLFSNIGSVGDSAFVNTDAEFSIKNVALFKPDFERVVPKYLFYLLRSPSVLGGLLSMRSGSAQPFIGLETLRKYSVRYHGSLSTQSKVVSVLSAYDDLIENNTRRIEILEEMARRLYEEWFVQFRFPGHEGGEFKESELGLIPEGWKVSALDEFGEIITGKTPSKNKPEFFGGDVPFIKLPDMHGNTFIIETTEKLSQEGVGSQKMKTIPPGSICVSCIGTAGVVVITSELSQTNQQINSIVPRAPELREFLFFAATSLKDKINNYGATGATMTNLSRGKFSSLQVVEPKEDLLCGYNKLAAPFFDKILCLQKTNRNLRAQRDLLLPKLISGEIDVSDIPMPT